MNIYLIIENAKQVLYFEEEPTVSHLQIKLRDILSSRKIEALAVNPKEPGKLSEQVPRPPPQHRSGPVTNCRHAADADVAAFTNYEGSPMT